MTLSLEIPDLDLAYLSLWLVVELDADPLVFFSFYATMSSIPQSEPEQLFFFIDSDQIVVVCELFDGWEMSVMTLLDFPTTRI